MPRAMFICEGYGESGEYPLRCVSSQVRAKNFPSEFKLPPGWLPDLNGEAVCPGCQERRKEERQRRAVERNNP